VFLFLSLLTAQKKVCCQVAANHFERKNEQRYYGEYTTGNMINRFDFVENKYV
jgi:hypothetical protein